MKRQTAFFTQSIFKINPVCFIMKTNTRKEFVKKGLNTYQVGSHFYGILKSNENIMKRKLSAL